ncbi:MFS transporter, partial [Pseudomonas paraeruginosa]
PLTLLWFRISSSGGKAAQERGKELQNLPGMSFREGMRSSKFWTCNLALALVISSIIGMVTSTVPMLQSKGCLLYTS